MPHTWNEIQDKDHLKQLKIAPVNRSHTTSYQSATVRIALSCTIFEILDVKECRDLEI